LQNKTQATHVEKRGKEAAAPVRCTEGVTVGVKAEGCGQPASIHLQSSAGEKIGISGAGLVQQPEFILPYLIYLLGHHPDMPKVSGKDYVL
jgi:hypothetical protein